ncbi:MAG: nucleoside phosphorylase [Desulfobacterales bacterium]|nr:nucleoside phosphorylase [Desulfobacterales bacterium]
MRDEIIYPRKGKHDPTIGPVAVMVSMEKDLALMRRSLDIQGRGVCRILTSRLYRATYRHQDITVVGPVLGAPHAVMILEKLIVLGAKRILFLGWCGSIQQRVQIADFVVPDRAVVGEGTSGYYPLNNEYPRASEGIIRAVEESLEIYSVPFHKGPVWSTDAPYRETRQKVLLLQSEGMLGVDMEISALFTVARFRQVEIGAILVVSDELGSLRWRRGFSSGKFKRSRKLATEIIPAICQKLNVGFPKRNQKDHYESTK